MFCDKLKELRLRHNLKQSDLAAAIGVSPSTIGMYEQGRREPDRRILLKICGFFSVSTDYFLQPGDMGAGRDIDAFLEVVCGAAEEMPLYYRGHRLEEGQIQELLDALEIAAAVACGRWSWPEEDGTGDGYGETGGRAGRGSFQGRVSDRGLESAEGA